MKIFNLSQPLSSILLLLVICLMVVFSSSLGSAAEFDNVASYNEVDKWSKFHDYDFRKYKGNQRVDKIARNLVDYEAGKTILDTVMGLTIKQNVNQTELF